MRVRDLSLMALAALLSSCSPFQTARMGTGYISHTLCTAAFVAGVDADRAYRDGVQEVSVISWFDWAVSYAVDAQRREVRAKVLGGFEQASVHHPGEGCRTRFSDAPSGILSSPPGMLPAGTAVLPPIAGPELVVAQDARLRRAVEAAFALTETGDGPRTKAVVVVHRGHVVAERYGEGYGLNTKVPGYSDTKSVVSALIGILVRQGKVSLHGPAPVSEWSGRDDPRRAITIDHLVRMRSGLEWDESLAGGPDDAARIWFLEPDRAALPLSRPLAHPPGSRWQYNTGNTVVLSRIIRDAAGGNRDTAFAFAQRELFGPLGMENVEWEFDATGTPNGGAGMSATARDWARFGVLYARDGVVGGRRILPEGWVDYSAAPAPDAFVGYGAGFWTNRGDTFGAKRRMEWGLPPSSFFASGHLGQIVLVVPEDDLVIARFGWSHGPYGGFGEMMPQFAEMIAAVKAQAGR